MGRRARSIDGIRARLAHPAQRDDRPLGAPGVEEGLVLLDARGRGAAPEARRAVERAAHDAQGQDRHEQQEPGCREDAEEADRVEEADECRAEREPEGSDGIPGLVHGRQLGRVLGRVARRAHRELPHERGHETGQRQQDDEHDREAHVGQEAPGRRSEAGHDHGSGADAHPRGCLQRRVHVRQQVIHVLQADRDAHQSGRDARGLQLRLVELAVGGRGRMDGVGDDAAEGGRHRRDGQPVDEGRSRLPCTEVHGEHAPTGSQLPLGDRRLGVARQARPGDPPHRRMGLQVARQGSRRLAVAVHAHVQRLQPAQHEERAEGSHDAAAVDAHAADGLDALPAPGHDAGDDVGVAAQPLRGRFHDEVHAEGQGPAEIGRRERVVHHDERPMRVSQVREPGQVGHHDRGVRDRLGVEEPRRRRPQRGLDGIGVGRVDVRHGDPEAPEDAVHERPRAAVHGPRGDDAIPRAHERQDGGVDGGHAGAEGEAGLRVVELGEGGRQGVGRGVLDARVGVAGLPEADEVRVLVDILGMERRRLVDGHGGRALLHSWGAGGGLDGPRPEAAGGRVVGRGDGHGTWRDSTTASGGGRSPLVARPWTRWPRLASLEPDPARFSPWVGPAAPRARWAGRSRGAPDQAAAPVRGSPRCGWTSGRCSSHPRYAHERDHQEMDVGPAVAPPLVPPPLVRRSAAGRCDEASAGPGWSVGRAGPGARSGRASV